LQDIRGNIYVKYSEYKIKSRIILLLLSTIFVTILVVLSILFFSYICSELCNTFR
jgi:ABC-type multidrug transport system permease subunit